MPHWLYTLLMRLLLPVIMGWMVWRGWRNHAHRDRLGERLGFGLARRRDHPLWLHAASVGEVQSLAGLVRVLQQRHPHQPLLITVGSPTGVTRARELFTRGKAADAAAILLSPLDLPGAARRFLEANAPIAGAIVETEIWPNVIAAAARAGVPMTMVSARVSEASTLRYLRFGRSLMRATLARIIGIGTQSAEDSGRFIRLGAEPASVQVIGNLKFDYPLPDGIDVLGQKLRARYAPGRPMWVAGSTHPVEEEACLAAHRTLMERARAVGVPAPLLVMAPRRTERFDAVAHWLHQQGIKFARHSSAEPLADPGSIDVLLVDTLGELLAFYAAGDVGFVGGSLVPVGGHNLLEPAALGKPVVCGPYSFNSPEAARLLDDAGALSRVKDAEELADVLVRLLGDRAAAAVQGERAAAAVVANRGAAARALAMIESSLPAAAAAEPLPEAAVSGSSSSRQAGLQS